MAATSFLDDSDQVWVSDRAVPVTHWKQVKRNCRWVKSWCWHESRKEFMAREFLKMKTLSRGRGHKIQFSLYVSLKCKTQHFYILVLAVILSINWWYSLQIVFPGDYIASQLPFFGFLFCGDTVRDQVITISFLQSICWLYSTGIIFLCSKTREVSVVKQSLWIEVSVWTHVKIGSWWDTLK